MINISYHENSTGQYIREWPFWNGMVPAVGDVVVLHYGDNKEEAVPYRVRLRVIDGTKPDYIKIFIEKLEE